MTNPPDVTSVNSIKSEDKFENNMLYYQLTKSLKPKKFTYIHSYAAEQRVKRFLKHCVGGMKAEMM